MPRLLSNSLGVHTATHDECHQGYRVVMLYGYPNSDIMLWRPNAVWLTNQLTCHTGPIVWGQ